MDDLAAALREARTSSGLSLSALSQRVSYSKPYLAQVETGKRAVTPDILAAYEGIYGGPLLTESEDMWRKEIKHPRLTAVRGAAVDDLAASLAGGDPSPLRGHAHAHWTDVALAARVDEGTAQYLRRWMRDGETSTIRTNALSIVAKLPGRANGDAVAQTLATDERVRDLCVASVVSRMLQLDWELSLRIARDPGEAPNPKRLAKAMAKEATNWRDTESRWCGGHMLQELAPVLAG